MKLLSFLFLLEIVSLSIQTDYIYDLKKLDVFSVDVSSLAFSTDGRTLFFSAREVRDSDTFCTNFYQMDLDQPSAVYYMDYSLFSTSIGYENRIKVYDQNSITVVSTAIDAIEKTNGTTKLPTDYCYESKCFATNRYRDIDGVCFDSYGYVEHADYTSLLQFDANGQLLKVLETNTEKNQWRNPEIQIPGKYDRRIYTKSCDFGECIYVWENGVETLSPFNEDGCTFDGLTFDPSNPNQYIYFHGHKTKDATELGAIKQGVVPRKNSKIYRTTFDRLKQGSVDQITDDNDSTAYVWPQQTNDPEQILATGIIVNPNDEDDYPTALFLLQKGKTPIQITPSKWNAQNAVLDPTGMFIAFISNGVIYKGKFLDSSIKNPVYTEASPQISDWGKNKTLSKVACYANENSTLKGHAWSRSYTTSLYKIIFTAKGSENDCPQVYIMDTSKNDTTFLPQKISTGMHLYTSPDFISIDSYLFGSTMSKAYNKNLSLSDNCHESVCKSAKPTELQNLCKKVIKEKSLPKDMELYTSEHHYVKQRLTFNNVFDGEAVINRGRVFYVSQKGGDYDIYQMYPNGTKIKQITNTTGFEGGITVSSDGNLIAYYATRPNTTAELYAYNNMSAYDFTDIGLTEIYLYDLQKNIEYQLTSFGNFSCHSPVFLDTTKNVGDNVVLYFICDDGLQSPGTVTNLFGIEIPRNVSDIINKKPVLIDTYTDPIFNLNTDGVVLSFNKLNDICIARNFDYEFPVESSSVPFGKSALFLTLMFVLLKFL